MRRLSTTRAAVRETVDAQHGVIARRQLVELGVPVTAIDHQLRARTLRPLHRGVYALGHRELRREGRWMAAVLACGPGAVLSHRSATAVWDLAPWGGRIDVSLPPGAHRRRHEGVRAHRVAALHDEEVTMVGRLPVTTVARTLLDRAVDVDDHRLEQLIHHADQRHRFDLRAVQRVLELHRGKPGTRRLARVVDRIAGVGAAPTRSGLEVDLLRLCERFALPRPAVNSRVVGYEVDFRWPGTNLVVEADGPHHRMPLQRERDHAKRLALEAAGFRVVTLTDEQVTTHAEPTAAALRRLIVSARLVP